MCANRHGQLSAERLTDRTVALVVKRAALVVGLDPTRLAGHSLRAGLATAAPLRTATRSGPSNWHL